MRVDELSSLCYHLTIGIAIYAGERSYKQGRVG